jgi:hypothetical protein
MRKRKPSASDSIQLKAESFRELSREETATGDRMLASLLVALGKEAGRRTKNKFSNF